MARNKFKKLKIVYDTRRPFNSDADEYLANQPLPDGIYPGAELPKVDRKNGKLVQEITLKIRVIASRDGSVELQTAMPGLAMDYTSRKFTGENGSAVHKFMEKLPMHLDCCILNLMEACYRMQRASREKRKDMYDRLISNFETLYRALLVWDRYRVIEEKEIPGGKLIISVPITAGNRSEFEPNELKESCILACFELEKCKRKITQENVAGLVFENADNCGNQKLRDALRTAGWKWKEIIAEYKRIREISPEV